MTLREARKLAGMSQKQLAGVAGMAELSISALERGIRNPHKRTQKKLEKILNAEIDWDATKKIRGQVAPGADAMLEAKLARTLYRALMLPPASKARVLGLLKKYVKHLQKEMNASIKTV